MAAVDAHSAVGGDSDSGAPWTPQLCHSNAQAEFSRTWIFAFVHVTFYPGRVQGSVKPSFYGRTKFSGRAAVLLIFFI